MRITDIQNDQVQWNDVPFCKCETLDKYKLKRGDIVIARTGATTGKNYLLEDLPEPTVFASYLIRLETFEEPKPKYLSLYMKSESYWRQITKVSKGSAQPGANASVLSKLTVPIAPKEQQTRIVTAIESLQQRSAKARTLLTEVEPLIDKLRQSILQSAFSGRLTADWRAKNPDVEPADQLLARIRVERRQRWEEAELAKFEAKGKTPTKGWRDKYKEPEPVDETELPELPEGWCWAKIDFLCSKVTDGTHHTPEYSPSGVPFISVKDIRNGKVSFDNCKFVSEETHRELCKRCEPEDGDVLITKSGTIGRTAIVNSGVKFSLFVSVALIKPIEREFLPRWIETALRAWIGSINIATDVKGSAIKNLHLNVMKEISIPIPPIAEQQAVYKKVNDAESSIAATLVCLGDSNNLLTKVDQSTLAKAFRGELVPQDPNDEPASELLARIQAAREAEASSMKASKKKAARKKKKTSP